LGKHHDEALTIGHLLLIVNMEPVNDH
jgi:hypothetical protein